jgi:hypothetical protein
VVAVGDVVLGILAVVIGLLFCFRGYLAMRLVIPIWGAFAGFMLGAGLVASFADEGFLASALGWLVGAGVAVLFALLAYLYYEVSVIIAMGAIGFSISTAVLVALGVTWSWLIILAGLALATLLAIVAIVGNLPMVILTVLSAFAGAGTIVAGAMLLFGVVDLAEFGSVATTERLEDDWWWYAIYLGLAITGIVTQVRAMDRLGGSLRESWAESGGRELRTV